MKRKYLAVLALLAAGSVHAEYRHPPPMGWDEGLAVEPLVDTERLAAVESTGRAKAINRGTRACGLYQLMPTTFRRFRDRSKANSCLDPEANRAAAFNYLNYLHAKHHGNRVMMLREWHSGSTRGKIRSSTKRFVQKVLDADNRPVAGRRNSPAVLASSAPGWGR